MVVPRGIFRSALALSLLGGCTRGNETPAPSPQQAAALAPGLQSAAVRRAMPCPPAMTMVVQSDGVTRLSVGPDPSDPTFCMYHLNGQRSIELFSVWPVSSTEPPGEIADMRTALATVLGGPVGTTASVHQERVVNEYFLQELGFVPKTGWRFTLRNAGTESISIAGKPYEAVKLSMTGQGEFRNLYSATWDFWLE